MYAVQVDKLAKVFGKTGFVAVNGISFNVEEGEVFGLLGPNGAGQDYNHSHDHYAYKTYFRLDLSSRG